MKRLIVSLLVCAMVLLTGCGRLTLFFDQLLGNDDPQPEAEYDQNMENSFISGENNMIISPEGSYITVITPEGNGMISVITPDNGEISVSTPDYSHVQASCPEWMFGAWLAWQGHYVQDGFGVGSGFGLYLDENGYGVLELSDGEVFENSYALNYTSFRLYGTWEIRGDIFRFTVTEDWYSADGGNIGQVWELPFAETENGFTLEYYDYIWTFQTHTDWNSYLDIIRKADGGPTGNDLTGTRDVSDSSIDGLAGSWKMYEDEGNGYKIRHLFRFNADGSFDYTRNRMALDGSTWIPVETIDPYISYGGYYMLNGYFTIAWDCYEVSGLAVTVNGDTMTMSTIVGDFFQDAMTGVFTRCDGSANPQP